MLYSEEVLQICKDALYPLSCFAISKKLGVTRKVARASLYYASKCLDKKLVFVVRSPLNNKRKHIVWVYNQNVQ